MLSRFKNAVVGAVGEGLATSNAEANQRNCLEPKFPYGRPHFLELSDEEVQMSADHQLRPIIHPTQSLPHNAGYAECVNAGKSKWNEDQAVIKTGCLTKVDISDFLGPGKYHIPYTYYGIFDGHAGVGAALCASKQLHHILHEKLVDALDDIWVTFSQSGSINIKNRNLLIIGALESAFHEMDQLIAEDRNKYQAPGGCTALVALIILGKLYVANAGDSRAIICDGQNVEAMSMDFTPERERERIRKLAVEQPDLLGKEFTFREYLKPPKRGDLGKPIMFKDPQMKGWAYKMVQSEDLKMPVITGSGKRCRVMGTIGVTRGFGDHDLRAVYQRVPIKPFLSPHPEVLMHSLQETEESSVLVIATDGLWDVIGTSTAAEIVQKYMGIFSKKQCYVSAATCLVGSARGLLKENSWQLNSSRPASVDDISVFVIPLLPYRVEYEKWANKYLANSTREDDH